MIRTIALTGAMLMMAASAHADGIYSRPDGHAPIGVMRDHVHKQGELMLSYRFGFMDMDGNRRGTSKVSAQQVLTNYMVSPTEMTMSMHMLGVMYGLTDQLTIAAMSGWADKEMDHVRRNGSTFVAETKDLTDSKLNAMYQFYEHNGHKVQLNAGISLPTGSITERNQAGQILPYPMQIGSGTYDLMPGVSYSATRETYSWGAQANATIRTGRNNRGYTLGNNYQLTAWAARKMSDAFSISIRLDGQNWDDISGKDRQLPAQNFPVPTADPSLQAGTRIDALAGINFIVPTGKLKGNRLAAEIGLPVYQNINGPRLETDYRLTLGWQLAF